MQKKSLTGLALISPALGFAAGLEESWVGEFSVKVGSLSKEEALEIPLLEHTNHANDENQGLLRGLHSSSRRG